jgi:hypothetical protein
MIKQTDRALANFARPASNFWVLAAGTIALICLVIGLVSSLSEQSYGLAGLFMLSIFGLAFFYWMNINQWKRITVGEGNQHLEWENDLHESQRQK